MRFAPAAAILGLAGDVLGTKSPHIKGDHMAALAREQWLRRCGLAALLMILGLWAVAPPAAAQQASAGVNGVVTDPTGAVVVGAEIDLTNVDTNVVRTTTRSEEHTSELQS